MNDFLRRLAPAVALSLPMLAVAQQTNPPAGGSPSFGSLAYRSAFADYKPWQEVSAGDWRQLNDNLRPSSAAAGDRAGHAATGSAAPQGAASASAGPPQPAAPSMPADPGHHIRGGTR